MANKNGMVFSSQNSITVIAGDTGYAVATPHIRTIRAIRAIRAIRTSGSNGLLHPIPTAANRAVKDPPPILSLQINNSWMSSLSGASLWPLSWPYYAPIHCGRSGGPSAVGASTSITLSPRAIPPDPAMPRPSTVAAIRSTIRRRHTRR